MKNCRDSSFSLRGLEAKLPAFRLQMLATRDVTELWSPRIATIYSDCDPLWLLQTKLLASAGWKRGCEPFGYRCSQHVTTCLFQESIPAIPFWISKHPIPSLQLQKKKQFHAEKQRVWPQSCRIQDLLRTIQWLCPRFGLQVFHCALRCDMWLLQTNERL